jgi:hypothetical protein
MARTTVRLTFRGDTLNDPIIYRLGSGWVELDMDGAKAEVDRALEYCRSRGIGVQQLEPQ